MRLVDLTKWIKSELISFYPEREIDSFIKIIYEYTINLEKTQILISGNLKLNEGKITKIKDIVHRLKKYEPIQYITGETFFYDCKIKVDEHVLIPRQETEELVDWIINDIKLENPKILDIGTGSGCIAIALARNIPGANVFASDYSTNILERAKKNSNLNDTRVFFFKHDLSKSLEFEYGNFDIIVSNPPYVLNKEKDIIPENVINFEPERALFVNDQDPLYFYKRISELTLNSLKKSGKLFFEINEKKGGELSELLFNKGFKDIVLKKDINEKDRFVKATL
jgi:release factor glutamine methyltransferase